MYHPLAEVTAHCVGSMLSSQPGLGRQRKRNEKQAAPLGLGCEKAEATGLFLPRPQSQ